MTQTPRSSQAVYHRAFILRAGPPPWPCFVCGEDVTDLGRPRPGEVEGDDPECGVVHHLDENPKNNEPGNLAAGHWNCHVRYHNGFKAPSTGHGAAISEALVGRIITQPHRDKIAATVRDRWGQGAYGSTPRRLTITDAEVAELRRRWSSGLETVQSLQQEFRVSQRLLARLVQGLTRVRRCRRGHELTEANLHTDPSGDTRCRTCRADSDARRYQRIKLDAMRAVARV